MRVNPNMSPDVLSGIQNTEQSLQTALEQLSTGKRVNQPSDNASASATMVNILATSARVDQYTKNSSSVLAQVQMADSALSAVVTSLSRAVSLGTEGATGSLTAANRQAIATQLQGVLSSVLAQANISYQGVGLFSGTAAPAQAFTADASSASGFKYNGNSGVNYSPVSDGVNVQINVPGSQIFDQAGVSVLGALSTLIDKLQNGTVAEIGDATTAVSSAISYVGQQRVTYANTVNQINAQESFLSQETINLTSQGKSLIGIDTAEAATALTQAQLAHSAVLAAAGKILPNTLLDYLK